jgi:putative flippase GtrA
MSWLRSLYRYLFRDEFVRFCLVGIVNTMHHYLWYVPLTWLTSSEIANTLAFFAAMIGSFYLNNYLTFKTVPSLKRFLRFPVTYIPQLIAAYLVPFIGVRYFNTNVYIVPIITTLSVLPLTYWLMRFVLSSVNSQE